MYAFICSFFILPDSTEAKCRMNMEKILLLELRTSLHLPEGNPLLPFTWNSFVISAFFTATPPAKCGMIMQKRYPCVQQYTPPPLSPGVISHSFSFVSHLFPFSIRNHLPGERNASITAPGDTNVYGPASHLSEHKIN